MSDEAQPACGLLLLPVWGVLIAEPQDPFFARYPFNFVWRFTSTYLVIVVFSYLFEQNREQDQADLNAINESLETLVAERTAALSEEIEKRRQAHQAMQLSRQSLMTILESIDANIYVADMDSHEIIFMNRHMQKDYGRDMTGDVCWNVLRGESAACPDCRQLKLIDAGLSTIGSENSKPNELGLYRFEPLGILPSLNGWP